MLLWLAFAVLTAAVVMLVARPVLSASDGTAATAGEADVAVYRDQLREIEADRERGLIGAAEAEAARLEVSRRLLAAAGPASAQPASTTSDAGRSRIVIGALALLSLAALSFYVLLGSPTLPGRPYADEPHVKQRAEIDRLVAEVEARLRARPEDGNGWDVIAPVYLKLQRYQDAAAAYANARRLLGPTAKRWAGFAEATLLAADGIVTEPARRAFEEVLRLEPHRIEPRFWLAMAKEQDGDLAGAISDYRRLLTSAEGPAPWRAAVEQRLAGLTARPGTAGGAPGPTAADVAAAEGMAPADRQTMIEQMVTGLAQRLAADGRNPEGWQRLIRAYVVLGRKPDALAALASARKALADDAAATTQLAALARSLALEP